MKRAAFTLIELLVVIAIIAILAMIAMPVFGQIQQKAKATNCASNLKQIGIGMAAYLSDHDDVLPAASGSGDNSWPRLLNPKYVPSWKVFRCPFDPVTNDRPLRESTPAPVSYGINERCFGLSTSKFVAPSQLILMAPALEPSTTITFTGTSENNPPLRLPTSGSVNYGTHSNRRQINALYGDMHVSSLSYKEFSTTSGDEGTKRWNPTGTAEN